MSDLTAYLFPGERRVAEGGRGVEVALQLAADGNEPHGLVVWVADATGRSLDLLHLTPDEARGLALALVDRLSAPE